MTKPFPAGARVTIGMGSGESETGRVLRWTRAQGPRDALPGFERVRFDSDGAVLLVHSGGLT